MATRRSSKTTGSDRGRTWRVYAVGLSAGAGLIHLMVALEHFAHWWGYGLFFLTVGAAQVVYAVTLSLDDPSRRVLIVGLLGNSLIVALYLITRTLGIPFVGPSAWETEPVGAVDLISKATELGLIVCLALMLRTPGDIAPENSLPSVAQGTILRKDEDA